MRLCFAPVAIVTLGVLSGCTGAPMCKYWTGAIIGKNADPSALPMLPYSPYWASKDSSLPVVGSPTAPCAGEPGYPGRLPS
jgi:hypothetical protein